MASLFFALSPFRQTISKNLSRTWARLPRKFHGAQSPRAQYLEAVREFNALLDAGAANEEHEFGGPVIALDGLIERDEAVHYLLPVRLTRPQGERSRTMLIERFGARV